MNGFCGGYDILTASQKMKECSKNKKKMGKNIPGRGNRKTKAQK